TKIPTGELPSSCGARAGKPGHSASIIIISPLMTISPWATFLSGPERRFSSSAPKVWLQNSISAAASRQNRRGITIDEFSGIPFFASIAPPNERNLVDPGILDRALFTLSAALVQCGRDRCYARRGLLATAAGCCAD